MSDIKLNWRIDRSAGGGPGGGTTVKALFNWTRGGKTIQTGSFTAADLVREIEKLEKKGMNVPTEFFEALQKLKTG